MAVSAGIIALLEGAVMRAKGGIPSVTAKLEENSEVILPDTTVRRYEVPQNEVVGGIGQEDSLLAMASN